MLDTARNWFSVEGIKKKILDPMHRTKLNVLHWWVGRAWGEGEGQGGARMG